MAISQENSALFVIQGSFVAGRVEKLAWIIAGSLYFSGDGHPVYMNVKNIQENTDPCIDLIQQWVFFRNNFNDLAIPRGNYGIRVFGNAPFRFTKKPSDKKEQSTKKAGDPQPGQSPKNPR